MAKEHPTLRQWWRNTFSSAPFFERPKSGTLVGWTLTGFFFGVVGGSVDAAIGVPLAVANLLNSLGQNFLANALSKGVETDDAPVEDDPNSEEVRRWRELMNPIAVEFVFAALDERRMDLLVLLSADLERFPARYPAAFIAYLRDAVTGWEPVGGPPTADDLARVDQVLDVLASVESRRVRKLLAKAGLDQAELGRQRKLYLDPPRQPQPDLPRCLLVHGPPYVGKTTWANQQATHWALKRGPGAFVYYFDAKRKDTFERFEEICSLHPIDAAAVIVVDDIHYPSQHTRTEWASAYAEFVRALRAPVASIWISRDPGSVGDLEHYVGSVESYPYGIDRVVDLFDHELGARSEAERVIALFEMRLDPNLAYLLRDLKAAPNFRAWLRDSIRGHFERWRADTDSSLRAESGSESGYGAYLKLLPFGSLAMPVDAEFLREIVALDDAAWDSLRRLGLAVTDKDRELRLTEHPFQIRQFLEYLRSRPTRKPIEPWARTVFGSYAGPLETEEAVFGRYLHWAAGKGFLHEALERLGNHAEWSGVKEPLARALTFVLNQSDWPLPDEDSHQLMVKWQRKLTRTSYPSDEDAFLHTLAAARLEWEQHSTEALVRGGKTNGWRLDTILYEIAYLDYLRENYHEAHQRFEESVAVGLGVVRQGMESELGSELRKDGAAALGHIWIAAQLSKCAQLRALIRDSFDHPTPGLRSATQMHLEILARDLGHIYASLFAANQATEETSAEAYLEALRVVAGKDELKLAGTPYPRRELNQQVLARHELNAWSHATLAACWPMLFGLRSDRVESGVPPANASARYEPTFPLPAESLGAPSLATRATAQLFAWTNRDTGHDFDVRVIATAAELKAAGGFEHLGDVMLLAWRACRSTETADAVKSYLIDPEFVPNVGFNALPKLAIQKFEEQGLSRMVI